MTLLLLYWMSRYAHITIQKLSLLFFPEKVIHSFEQYRPLHFWQMLVTLNLTFTSLITEQFSWT